MRVIILDPSLDGAHGHHALYDRVIAREFHRRGVEPMILAHEDFGDDTLDGTSVKSLFQTTAYRAFSKSPLFAAYDDVEQGNQAVYAELSATPNDFFKPSDLVVVHTVSEITIVGLVTWIASLPKATRPCVCIFLMLPAGVGHDDEGTLRIEKPAAALAYREAFRVVREHELNVHFYGSGPQHARQFSELAGEEIPAHPILTIFDEIQPEGEELDDFVLLFAGDAKINKGVDKLPGVIEALCPAHPDLRFIVHANPAPAWGAALEAVNALRAMADDHPNLELELASLSSADYADVIRSAATVLLPYDPKEYHRKSSGVVWEAIASASTLVTPADTWLDDECRFWRASHASYTANEPEIMAEAVTRALGADRAERTQAADRFAAANGVKAMVDQLTDQWMRAGTMFSTSDGETIHKDASELVGRGWYEVETVKQKPARWSSAAATVTEYFPTEGTWSIEFTGWFSYTEDQVSNASILVDGEALETTWLRSDNGAWCLSAVFVEENSQAMAREITLQAGRVEQESEARRQLGLLVHTLSIAPVKTRGDGPSREPAVPVSGHEAPGPDGWTDPLTAATYKARAHAGDTLTVRFDARSDDDGPLDLNAVRVILDGQPVKPDWQRSDDLNEAHGEVHTPAAPIWESLELEIVSASPVRLRMGQLEWCPAELGITSNAPTPEVVPGLATEPEESQDMDAERAAMETIAAPPTEPDWDTDPVWDSTPIAAVPDPTVIAQAAQAAREAGLVVSCAEDRSGEAHASITLGVSSYRAFDESFSTLYIKLLSGKGYYGVELRENDGAFQLLHGLDVDKVDVDGYGGYVRIFVNRDTAQARPELTSLASDARPLVSLLAASADLIEQKRVQGLSEGWLEVARTVTDALTQPADDAVQVTCAEDRSGEEHASLTLQIKGLSVQDRTLPTFFLKLLKGAGYAGVELRENDGAFVLLPGLDSEVADTDEWGPYLRLVADPDTTAPDQTPDIPDTRPLEAAVKAVDEALMNSLDGVDASMWSASTKAANAIIHQHNSC